MFKFAIAVLVGAGAMAAIQNSTSYVFAEAKGSKVTAVSTLAQDASNRTTARGFRIHSIESASAETKEPLQWYVDNFQFVPNLAGVMAESPELLNSYWGLTTSLQAGGELSPPEDNIVQLTIAAENKCQYCVAGGTMAGKMFFKSTDEQLEALRTSSKLADAKFEALRAFSADVYNSRGRVSEKSLQKFLDAGYSRRAALEVVANVASKVMTNFTNQMTLNPMDDMLKPFAEGLPFKEDRPVINDQ